MGRTRTTRGKIEPKELGGMCFLECIEGRGRNNLWKKLSAGKADGSFCFLLSFLPESGDLDNAISLTFVLFPPFF